MEYLWPRGQGMESMAYWIASRNCSRVDEVAVVEVVVVVKAISEVVSWRREHQGHWRKTIEKIQIWFDMHTECRMKRLNKLWIWMRPSKRRASENVCILLTFTSSQPRGKNSWLNKALYLNVLVQGNCSVPTHHWCTSAMSDRCFSGRVVGPLQKNLGKWLGSARAPAVIVVAATRNQTSDSRKCAERNSAVHGRDKQSSRKQNSVVEGEKTYEEKPKKKAILLVPTHVMKQS